MLVTWLIMNLLKVLLKLISSDLTWQLGVYLYTYSKNEYVNRLGEQNWMLLNFQKTK